MKGYRVIFGPHIPGTLNSCWIIGFEGPGESGQRSVNHKARAKARAHRKRVRRQKRRTRN